MISYNMLLVLLIGMFATTFLLIGCFLLILKPWVKPMRRTWQNSQDVMAEHLLVSAADAKRQAAEEQDKANKAATTAERSRQELIRVQAESDQAEIQRRAAIKQASIEAAIAAEEIRLRLIQAKAEADRAEIERRKALKKSSINPDALSPRQVKRRLLIILMVTIGLFIIAIAIRTYFSK